jgi:hypothetical protein
MAPQQSDAAPHAVPSAPQAERHASDPPPEGTQEPVQHSPERAQPAPSPWQPASGPGGTQRFDNPPSGGSCKHLLGAQQSPSPPHTSPSCPQGGLPGLQSPIVQFFEQHWPFEEQSAHSGVHPPAATQRIVVSSQMREQQSLFEPQASSTWRIHPILSLLLHIMGR